MNYAGFCDNDSNNNASKNNIQKYKKAYQKRLRFSQKFYEKKKM